MHNDIFASGRNPKPPKRYEEKEKKRKRHKSSSAKSVKDSDRYAMVYFGRLSIFENFEVEKSLFNVILLQRSASEN